MRYGYVFRWMRGNKAVDSMHFSPPFHSIDVTLPAQTHTHTHTHTHRLSSFIRQNMNSPKYEFALYFLLVEYKFPRTRCFTGGPPPLSIPTQAECCCNRNKFLLLSTSLPQCYDKRDKHFVKREASCDDCIDF